MENQPSNTTFTAVAVNATSKEGNEVGVNGKVNVVEKSKNKEDSLLGLGKWYHFDQTKGGWLPVSDQLQITFDQSYIEAKKNKLTPNASFSFKDKEYKLEFDLTQRDPYGRQVVVSDRNQFLPIIRQLPVDGKINSFSVMEPN